MEGITFMDPVPFRLFWLGSQTPQRRLEGFPQWVACITAQLSEFSSSRNGECPSSSGVALTCSWLQALQLEIAEQGASTKCGDLQVVCLVVSQ